MDVFEQNSFTHYLNVSGSLCSIIALALTVSIGLQWFKIVAFLVALICAVIVGAFLMALSQKLYHWIAKDNTKPIWRGVYWLFCIFCVLYLFGSAFYIIFIITGSALHEISELIIYIKTADPFE